MDEFEQDHEQKEKLSEVFKQDNPDLIRQALEDFPPALVAEVLEETPQQDIIGFIKLLADEEAGRLYSYLDLDQQYELTKVIDKRTFARIFKYMYSECRTDLFREFSKEEQIELLPYLDKKTRENVMVLSTYSPDTAGGTMSTDFATVVVGMTCQEAMEKIRQDAPSKKMIYYVYVVSTEMEMLGIITIKDLIMAKPTDLVDLHFNDNFIYVNVNDDRELVAAQIEKHDLVAIPVLNNLSQLVGIVSHEEAIDIIRAEQTEDMEKFMGILPSDDEDSYLDTTVIQHFKRRVVWLVSLAGVGLISGVIVHHYQHVIEQLIILALYMPMMTATGGNTGSQAATVVIRAMALDQVTEDEWFRVLFKEAKISLMLGLCVGGLVFIKIAYLSSHSLLPNNITPTFIGLMIALAISLQVVSSALVGAGLPLLVRKLGGDPAVAASPAITTTVDITGLLIYFAIASSLL